MLVRLYHTAEITRDLTAESVTWWLPASGETGQAQFWVPRGDPAFSALYLREAGGSLVELTTPGGTWQGVTQRLNPTSEGVMVTADEALARANTQSVAVNAKPLCVTPGTIVQLAANDCLGDADTMLRPGTFGEGVVIVDEYDFAGKTLGQVLNDMHGKGSGEARVVAGTLSWVPPTGTLHSPLLEGGDVWDVAISADARESISEVVATGEAGDFVSVRAPEVTGANYWRPRVVITVPTRSTERLLREAKARLLQGIAPQGRISFQLAPSRWAAVREGDYLPLIVPSLGLAGRTLMTRIIGRAWSEADGTMIVTAQEIPDFTAASVAGVLGERPSSPAPPPTPSGLLGALRDLTSRVSIAI